MSTSELVRRFANLIRAKNATTFYLDGPPGSGKSHLLGEVAKQLSAELSRALVLGPYSLKWAEATGLGNRVLQDCWAAGFLDESPPMKPELDLVSAWKWFGENAHTSPRQSFLVLVDLVEIPQSSPSTTGNLFSNARRLEGIWNRRDVKIFHLFAGYWDHPSLEHYYHSINTSFPYTIGHNYAVWNGLSREEIVTLTNQVHPGAIHPLHGWLLFELTGGHPAAAMEILDQIEADDLSFPTLLSSTYQAAANGPSGQALLRVWRRLPDESRSVLKDLIFQRRVSATQLPPHLERLHTAGIVRSNQVGSTRYLDFRSWYIELLVRLHAEELGIADEQTRRIRIDELVPKTSELNVEAYRLINNIENQARNFVAVHLCLGKARDEPILEGKSKKYNEREYAYEYAHQRALNWRDHSADRGLPVELNPLMAYLSVRDLADLIAEIGADIHSQAWQHIAQAIQDLASVRDAVMHNQLVDDAALQRLYDLQADIYAALSETR